MIEERYFEEYELGAERRTLGRTITETDVVLHHETDPGRAVARAEEIAPTVILQDLVMPDIDGLTLLRRFQEHAQLRAVPTIVPVCRVSAETGTDHAHPSR